MTIKEAEAALLGPVYFGNELRLAIILCHLQLPTFEN